MALRKARVAVASSHEVEAAAEELLAKGNAVDAVVAGVFAACATAPGALLGPVQILIGGAGAGMLALDGRVRQPGLGAPRPRGFVEDETVPDAAKVGVPWLPATVSAALATAGSATVAQVLAPAVALAKGTPRAEIFARLASRGPRALEERPLATELLAACGRVSGGLLTSEDLASPRPPVHKSARFTVPSPRGARVVSTLPWAHVEDGAPRPPAHLDEVSGARAVLAVDRNATFAIACWDEGAPGITLGELGLRAPFFAEPVRRGQTRVKPGDARPASGPIAIVGSDAVAEVAFAAFGARDAYDVLQKALLGLIEDERIEAHGESRLVAVSHAKGNASAFKS